MVAYGRGWDRGSGGEGRRGDGRVGERDGDEGDMRVYGTVGKGMRG